MGWSSKYCPVPRKLLLAADANPNLARQEDGVWLIALACFSLFGFVSCSFFILFPNCKDDPGRKHTKKHLKLLISAKWSTEMVGKIHIYVNVWRVEMYWGYRRWFHVTHVTDPQRCGARVHGCAKRSHEGMKRCETNKEWHSKILVDRWKLLSCSNIFWGRRRCSLRVYGLAIWYFQALPNMFQL